MSLLCKQFTFLAAFLVVMGVQAYGTQRGFASHHAFSMLATDVAGQGTQGDGSAPQEQDGTDSVTVDMDMRHSADSHVHFAFYPVQLAEVSIRDWIWCQHQVEAEVLLKARAEWFEPGRLPATVEVVRCMVLLI